MFAPFSALGPRHRQVRRPRRLAALAAAALVVTSAPLVAAPAASAQEVVCPGTQFAYVANSGDATVSVIDITSDPPHPECVKTIDLEAGVDTGGAVDPGKVTVSGVAPFGVVASPARDRVYVTHGAGNRVSVIETKNHTVAATVEVGPSATAVLTGAAISPDGERLYVVATADAAGATGRLYRINTAKIGTPGAVGEPVPVGIAPTGVAVASTPAGERVYVTNTADGTVSVLKPTSSALETVTTVPVGDAPTAVAANPERNEVYVVNTGGEKSDTVSRLQESSDDACPEDPDNLPKSPGATEDCAASMSSISVIDTADNVVSDTWVSFLMGAPILVVPTVNTSRQMFTGVAVSPDGERVYVTATALIGNFLDPTSWRGTVYSLDPSFESLFWRQLVGETEEQRRFWDKSALVGDDPTGVAVGPGGARVYVTNTGGHREPGDPGTVSVLEFDDNDDPADPTDDGDQVDDTFAVKGDPVPVGAAPTGVATIAFAPEPPAIVTHPASHAATESRTTTFTVEVTGAPPFTYRWYRNGTSISDAIGASFTTGGVVLKQEDGPDHHGARYHVEVTGTGPGGEPVKVTSEKAVLTVVAVPEVVEAGEFKAAAPDPDPDAPGFHRLGTMGSWESPPPALNVDPVNGIGVNAGHKPYHPKGTDTKEIQDWHDKFHAPERCNEKGDALYVYDLYERRATRGLCDVNTHGLGSGFQPLPGVGGRILAQTGAPACTPSSADPGPRFQTTRGLAYEIGGIGDGDGVGRSVSVRAPKPEGNDPGPLFLRPCPLVGGAPVNYGARVLTVHSAPLGDDELVTLESNSEEALARGLTTCATFLFCGGILALPNTVVSLVANINGRGHENVLLRSFGIPGEAPLFAFGEEKCGTDNGKPVEVCANEVEVSARWEVDLRPFCPSWLGSWVARTDNAVLTYCWDERPPGDMLELPGLSNDAPMGFLVKIPLDADGYPIPRPGTEGLAEHLPGSDDCPSLPTTTTTTTTTTAAPTTTTTTTVPGCEDVLSETREPAGPDERDLLYEPGSGRTRVLNATIRKIPTLPGKVRPVADPQSGRVFLLSDDDVNGVAVWVMDPDEERFVGTFTSGIPRSNVKAYEREHYRYLVKKEGQINQLEGGHRTAVGFNAALGRAYILGPEGILVVDGRSKKVEGVSYPALGTYGVGEHELLPSNADGIHLEDLYAYSLGGRHYVAIPVGGRGYVLFEDKIPVPGPGDPLDPDALTVQREEREGETVSALSGAGEAAGAHVVVAGGVTKTANTTDPGCQEVDGLPILGTGDAALNLLVRASSFESRMFDGGCLADVLVARGHREAYLGSSKVESGTAAGAFAGAQSLRVPSSDTATDADLHDTGECGAGKSRRGAEGVFDYTTHAPASDPQGAGGDPGIAGDPGIVGVVVRQLQALPFNGQNQLAEESLDWVPEDPAKRNSSLLAPLLNPLFGGYGDFCSGVRDNLPAGADLDPSEGTAGPDGQGFPARAAVCTESDSDSVRSGPEGRFPSEVACRAPVPAATASSSTGTLALPGTEDPVVVVEAATSSIESRRVVEGGKAYQVTEAEALATGVRIGPVSIGTVRTTAVNRAGGRTGTATATLTREWCDVAVSAEVLTRGCSIVTGPEDPLVARVADEARQAFPKLRLSVPEAEIEKTPGGYQSVVTKDESLRITDSSVNDDDSITVSALQVTFLNDGAEGRNRWVVQLAGVHTEARYGITVLPTFKSSGGFGSFTSTRATPSTRKVVPGRKALPRASTLIEGESFDAYLAGSPVPKNPARSLLAWIPEALKDLLRLLIQHPLEFALLFLVFSLLATPPYLAYRRRTAMSVLTGS